MEETENMEKARERKQGGGDLSALGLNNPTRDGELQRATRHVHVHTDSLALLILAQPVAPFPVAVDFERPFGGEEAVSAALVPQIRLDVDVWRRDPYQTLVPASKTHMRHTSVDA
eukprot:816744-Rhodomonas_salina.1